MGYDDPQGYVDWCFFENLGFLAPTLDMANTKPLVEKLSVEDLPGASVAEAEDDFREPGLTLLKPSTKSDFREPGLTILPPTAGDDDFPW